LALGARLGRLKAAPTPGSLECALALAKALGPGWGSRLDAGGMPPLARLCLSAGFVEPWMEALAAAGACPLAFDGQGLGLLEAAALLRPQEGLGLAKWALERGADASRACPRGALPHERAFRLGALELAEFLRSRHESVALGLEALGAEEGSSGRGRL
jgi:hypothetical protein